MGIELRKHYPHYSSASHCLSYFVQVTYVKNIICLLFLVVIDGVPEVSRASGDPPPFKLPLTGNGEN